MQILIGSFDNNFFSFLLGLRHLCITMLVGST